MTDYTQYGIDYLAVLGFIVLTAFILFESEDVGNNNSFITSKNFRNWIWCGFSLVFLGIVLHVVFGHFGPMAVAAPANETILNLLMFQKVSYRTGICVALGYALIFSAVLLKLLNVYFILKKNHEKDI